jgi:hypothetical protein
VAFLAAAAAPAAAVPLRLSAADRTEIGVLLDAFVRDVVRREDLTAGWRLTGPDLRAGTTRKAWVGGTGVTVQSFAVRGTDFRHAWTGKLVEPRHAVLSMVLQVDPKRSDGTTSVVESISVVRAGGRWVVDTFYPAALMKGHGSIVGSHDFGPGGGAAPGSGGRISGAWLVRALELLGLLAVAVPVAVGLHLRRRDRKAREAYELRR